VRAEMLDLALPERYSDCRISESRSGSDRYASASVSSCTRLHPPDIFASKYMRRIGGIWAADRAEKLESRNPGPNVQAFPVLVGKSVLRLKDP
jgi:hypothetical protein